MNLPANILIVDDNGMNRKLLRAILESEGLKVFEAGDGAEALAVLEREKVDATITDVLMPRMDGYTLCYEIRKSARFRSLPLIVYTSTYSSPADEEMAYLAGADKYLVKPAPAATLLKALEDIHSEEARDARRPGQAPEEAVVMREYNATLIRKLEQKEPGPGKGAEGTFADQR
jgi:CheY-like chemotaxis protein